MWALKNVYTKKLPKIIIQLDPLRDDIIRLWDKIV